MNYELFGNQYCYQNQQLIDQRLFTIHDSYFIIHN
jgi:hypothetical protein